MTFCKNKEAEAVAFCALLMRMRNGQVTDDDSKRLLQRSTNHVLMATCNH